MCAPSGFQQTRPNRACVPAALIAVLVLGHTIGNASEPVIERVAILERGIYSAESTGATAAIATLGAVQRVRNAKLVESTTRIPGRRMVRFGVRYVVHGAPLGAETEIRLVTRFPDREPAGASDHRMRHLYSEYKIRSVLGSAAYREFLFDDVREIVPGEWVFEFWFGTRKVGEQKFCVYDVARENPGDGCLAAVASLPGLP